jgi:hypothetical protein
MSGLHRMRRKTRAGAGRKGLHRAAPASSYGCRK